MKVGMMVQIKTIDLFNCGFVRWYQELIKDNAVGVVNWISNSKTHIGFISNHPSVPNTKESINIHVDEVRVIDLYKEVV